MSGYPGYRSVRIKEPCKTAMGKSSSNDRRGESPGRTKCGFLKTGTTSMTERASGSLSVLRSHGRHTGNASEDKPQTAVSGGSDPDRAPRLQKAASAIDSR